MNMKTISNNVEEISTFEAKQLWIERIMASKLTPAQKVFAFGIWSAMYGDKIESFPGTKYLEGLTNLSRSKFGQHRAELFACKAMSGVLAKHEDGDYDNYTYTLNLDWDGGGTQRDTPVTPTGNNGGTQREQRVTPTGCSNTSIQDIKEDINLKTKGVADAPPLTEVQEAKEEVQLKTVVVTPPLPKKTTALSLELDKARAAKEHAAAVKADLDKPLTEEEEYRASLTREERDQYRICINQKRMPRDKARAYIEEYRKTDDLW